eukprot:15365166-Ditylum_brightwellii.AAC.2
MRPPVILPPTTMMGARNSILLDIQGSKPLPAASIQSQISDSNTASSNKYCYFIFEDVSILSLTICQVLKEELAKVL